MASAAALQTSVYQGDRKHGRMEGHGKYTFPSGTVYTGQLLDGEGGAARLVRLGTCTSS